MNEISTSPHKELNDLLPTNLLSEMDIDTEGTHTYEDTEDEIVDDLAYHPNQNSTQRPIENKERYAECICSSFTLGKTTSLFSKQFK